MNFHACKYISGIEIKNIFECIKYAWNQLSAVAKWTLNETCPNNSKHKQQLFSPTINTVTIHDKSTSRLLLHIVDRIRAIYPICNAVVL